MAMTVPAPKSPRRVREEASNSFALFVVMLPLLMGAFGMGLDMSRNVFIRTELQNALDLAVVGGAAEVKWTGDGTLKINQEAAVNTTERLYNLNRAHASALICEGHGTIPEGGGKRCWEQYGEPKANGVEYVYGVTEKSRNAFLPVIGVEYQSYNIVSRASLRQDADANEDPK